MALICCQTTATEQLYCTPGCEKHFGHREGSSASASSCSVCPRKEESEQVSAKSWDAGAAVTCVGGDRCSMPAASALAIFCHFVGSTAGGRLGETPEHGRDAEQPRHNAQETHGAASRGWEPLAQGDFCDFCFSWMVVVGYLTVGSKTGISSLALGSTPAAPVAPVQVGRAAPARSCGVAGVQHNFCSLSQQRYCFIFQTLKAGKDVKLPAPKNTSTSPLSGRVFTSCLHHD